MKKLIAYTLFVLLSASLSAQGVFSNNTISCLEKVIRDYPHRFASISGEQIKKTAGETDFQSRVRLAGSKNCKVTRYEISGGPGSCSWDCIVLETGNQDSALNKFRELFSQIRNSIIRLPGDKPAILNSSCNKPVGDLVVFDLLPTQGDTRKLRVRLSIQSEINLWLVSIHVYEGEIPGDEPVLANH
jgi:hypothetical protein